VLEVDFQGRIKHDGPGNGLMIPSGMQYRYEAKPISETALPFVVEDTTDESMS